MRKYVSELIGSFALVFCGTGAIVINEHTGGTVTHVGIGITFWFIVMAMIYALGDISGCHIHPAVTIAFAIAGRFDLRQVLPYALSQLLGAVIASLTMKALFPSNETLGTTLPAGTALQAFILAFILTFF